METKALSASQDGSDKRMDDAARAGWLYYVAGRRQDEIAKILGVSRQSAQRLISYAMESGLVKVRIDHPISALMEKSALLKEKFGLTFVELVPSDPYSESTTVGIAEVAAVELERRLRQTEPAIFAIGTGRTLKAAIDLLPQMECPQHKIISLAGNIAPDGSASFYNVIFSIADASKAPSFPMPLPVVASTAEERALLHKQPIVANALELAQKADVAFIGVGDLGPEAPLCQDGFVTLDELAELRAAGGVGEICGWAFDAEGRYIEGLTNTRVASGSLPSTKTCQIILLAKGDKKLPGIRAAILGGLANGLITDEATADMLLAG